MTTWTRSIWPANKQKTASIWQIYQNIFTKQRKGMKTKNLKNETKKEWSQANKSWISKQRSTSLAFCQVLRAPAVARGQVGGQRWSGIGKIGLNGGLAGNNWQAWLEWGPCKCVIFGPILYSLIFSSKNGIVYVTWFFQCCLWVW